MTNARVAKARRRLEAARGPGTNTGHGQVWPRPDGVRVGCGGPPRCPECMSDAKRWPPEPAAPPPPPTPSPERIASEVVARVFQTARADGADRIGTRPPAEWLALTAHAGMEAQKALEQGSTLILPNGSSVGYDAVKLAEYRRWMVEMGAVCVRAALEIDLVMRGDG